MLKGQFRDRQSSPEIRSDDVYCSVPIRKNVLTERNI